MLDVDVSKVIIQIIAFLMMVWVMKRFGWQPLLNILETRRKKIQGEFDSIAAQKEEVKRLCAQYEERLRKIDMDAKKIVQEAVVEGQKVSTEIQESAQANAKEILHKAKAELDTEVENAKHQLQNTIVNLVITTTEKILQEKLDTPNQKKLIANFVEEAQL